MRQAKIFTFFYNESVGITALKPAAKMKGIPSKRISPVHMNLNQGDWS
jgi:hypothetical protein